MTKSEREGGLDPPKKNDNINEQPLIKKTYNIMTAYFSTLIMLTKKETN